jgi:hypothetical protein
VHLNPVGCLVATWLTPASRLNQSHQALYPACSMAIVPQRPDGDRGWSLERPLAVECPMGAILSHGCGAHGRCQGQHHRGPCFGCAGCSSLLMPDGHLHGHEERANPLGKIPSRSGCCPVSAPLGKTPLEGHERGCLGAARLSDKIPSHHGAGCPWASSWPRGFGSCQLGNCQEASRLRGHARWVAGVLHHVQALQMSSLAVRGMGRPKWVEERCLQVPTRSRQEGSLA